MHRKPLPVFQSRSLIRNRSVRGNADLSNNKIRMLIELLDGVYPKGVLKELNAVLRQSLKR